MPLARHQPKGNPTLTAALKTLKRLQEKHNGVVEASDFKDDEQRAVLVETGFLRPVMKGWYICSSPSNGEGPDGHFKFLHPWPGQIPPGQDSEECLSVG